MFDLLRKSKKPENRSGILTVGHRQVPFTFRRYPKSKGVRLIVGEDAKLKITAPLYASWKAVSEFVKIQKMWILQQVSYFERLTEIDKNKPLDKILYLGKIYRVESILGSKRSSVSKDVSNISVKTDTGAKEEIRKALAKWYKREAKSLVEDTISKHNIAVDINKISIRDQKTCWGSASSKNNINFNWKLAMAPVEVLEYVVIHELSHLKHMNHSKRFWSHVEKYCPNYKQHKKWLKQNKDLLKI